MSERREQILAAARAVFATTPYHEVTSARLAEEAGVTRGLLHHYFGGRREIFLAVVADLRSAITAAAGAEVGTSPEAMVAASVERFLDAAAAERELLLAVLGAADAGGDPEIVAELDAVKEAVVDRILLDHTGSAEQPEHVRLVVRGYLGLAEAASREWLTTGPATREEVRALLVRARLALMADVAPTQGPAASGPAAPADGV